MASKQRQAQMTQPAKHARTDSVIVFPAPIPDGCNPDGPIKPDYSCLVSAVFEANDLPTWCGVLVDRVYRFSESVGPAFVHIQFLPIPVSGADQVLVGLAYVARDPTHFPHFSTLGVSDLEKLKQVPTATCYGMAIHGPGLNYAVCRMVLGTPLAVLRRQAESKWPTGKSLLLTSGWGSPSAEMGPRLRNEVVPHLGLGLDDRTWWEKSDSW